MTHLRALLASLACLVALLVPAAGAVNASSALHGATACAFMAGQPRYAQVSADLLVWNAKRQSPESIFLNDALLRAVTRQLGLAPCQVRASKQALMPLA